jgi:tetratricopeptide (TPR) repeat protein
MPWPQIALEENDKEGAISNFRKSLNVSEGNAKQKAEAYLALADLYMDDEEYLQASYHYDSTLMVLPKTDERYEEVQVLSENLTQIARNIETIALQDSLLRIAAMSPEEQKELATQMKKKEDQEKLNAIAAKANTPNTNSRSLSPTVGRNALQKESAFFAYDDKAVKRGQREFQRKWGSRPLEDNWRRSSDQAQFDQVAEITEAIEAASAVSLTDDEIAAILDDVPATETEKLAAQLKIQEALFNLGKLYREKLENNDKAIEALEGLLDEYPGTSFSLDAWYYLYLAYQQKNQMAKAQEYANLIVKNYPASNYAKVIQDPNYLNELKSEEMLLNAFYDRAFANFSAGNYQEAYQMATVESTRQFGNQNSLQAKFSLLAALCTGNLKGKDAYVTSLQEVVVKFPDSEEQTKAREILRLLGIRGNGLPGRATAEEGDNKNYKVEENALHYMLVVFNAEVRLSDVTSEVSDYNRKYYQLEKYRYSQMFLGRTTQDGIPVLVIRRFKNKGEGMKYYDAIMNNRDEFIRSVTDFDIFLVSQNNYREILRSKSLAGYKDFFEQNYLQ